MWETALFRATVGFAIASAASTAVLAGIALRGELPRRARAAPACIAGGMVLATIYHIGLASLGREPLVLESLLILCYLLLTIALGVVLASRFIGGGSDGTLERVRSIRALLVGVALFAVGAPLVAAAGPSIHHLTHGVAGLIAGMGVYRPQTTSRGNRRLPSRGDESVIGSYRPEWLVPTDRAVLALLRSSGLVLTPAVMAFNIERSRAEVNRRLRELEAAGLVERVERGKYRIGGPPDAELRGSTDDDPPGVDVSE